MSQPEPKICEIIDDQIAELVGNEQPETEESNDALAVLSEPILSTTLSGRSFTMNRADAVTIGRFYRMAYCKRIWGYNPSWLYGEVPLFASEEIRKEYSRDTVYRLEAFESLEVLRWTLEQFLQDPNLDSEGLSQAYRAIVRDAEINLRDVQSVSEALVEMHQFFSENLEQLLAAMPVIMEGIGHDLGDWGSFLGLWLNLFQEAGDLNTVIRIAGTIRDFVNQIQSLSTPEGAELNDRFYSISLVNLEPNAICEFLNQLPPQQLFRQEYAHQLADSFLTIPWIQQYWTEEAGLRIIETALALHWQENNHPSSYPVAYDLTMLSSLLQHYPNIVDRNLYPRYNRDPAAEMVTYLLYLATNDDPSSFSEEELRMVTNLIVRAQSAPRTKANDIIGGFQSGRYFEQYLALISEHNPALFQHYQVDPARDYGLYTVR